MKRPLRKACVYLVIATLAAVASMHFQHKFFRQLRRLQPADEVRSFEDFAREAPQAVSHPSVVYLNADEEHNTQLQQSAEADQHRNGEY